MRTTTNTNTLTSKTRYYGYTDSKANVKYLEQGAKTHGSKAKFLEAIVTEARRTKLEIKAPTTSKTVTKKVKARVRQ